MKTAIIGVGQLGSALARNLVRGGDGAGGMNEVARIEMPSRDPSQGGGLTGALLVARPEASQRLLSLGGERHPASWPFARRRGSAGVARGRQIEGAPKELDRAAFAYESGAVTLQYASVAKENSPPPVHKDRVIACVNVVGFKRDPIVDFHRVRVYLY